MKCLLLCMWTWVLLVSMGCRSMGCLEEERNAMLHIMAAFGYPNESNYLWWGDIHGDCCGWDGVECDNTTLRVTQLNLSCVHAPTTLWVIDASLFCPLKELQVLDLSINSLSDLNGTVHLKKLKQLDLSYNDLKGVPSLYKQTSPEAQNLPSDQLEGVNLEVLSLTSNNLVNDALMDIRRITSLKALHINSCGLNASSKLLEGLCGLRNLEELDISENKFWGPLPSCLCNMTSLRVLDMANNNFSGAIPSSLLSNLQSLKYLVLSGNAFTGSLSLTSLANNSDLEVFHLVKNRNHLEANTEDPTWFPSFQLKEFGLSDCVLNKDANGIIPSFLKEQHELTSVQLSQNGMTGNFPDWLLDNNVNLVVIELKGNNLLGAFYLPSNLTLDSVEFFDASANAMEGELPSWIGSIFPKLVYLNLANNLFKGKIPSSMGNLKQMDTLDLSNNGFTGEIPKMLGSNSSSLFALKLSGNNLRGQMPFYNLPMLTFLYLDGNYLTGNILPGILNSSGLRVLDVADNSLSGKVPNWIGDVQYLKGLILSNNLLGGPLPLSFCNLSSLVFLDLSSNNLGPYVPPCADVVTMRFLHLTNDALIGHFPEFVSRASFIETLDLRHNALSGKVPNWIGSLLQLKVLLLQGNNFEGSIPLDLCLLKSMTILDLSNNNLSGKIPHCLEDLTFKNDGAFIDSSDNLGDWEGYGEGRTFSSSFELEEVNFTTKSRLESYKGYILQLMSGLDLSHNNLTGFIPLELGNLSELRALNLSHNHLTGPIPKTFSNLKNVESLDLSYNSLIGPIPPQLTELYALSNFRVAHNNLSGKTPDRKNQFGTFDEASYEGNLLCGPPLTSCNDSIQWGRPPSFNHTREDDSWREVFLWSFVGSYVVAFLGMVLFLHLNSYYQCVLFKLVRKFIPSFPH